jgi:hypothetical protein
MLARSLPHSELWYEYSEDLIREVAYKLYLEQTFQVEKGNYTTDKYTMALQSGRYMETVGAYHPPCHIPRELSPLDYAGWLSKAIITILHNLSKDSIDTRRQATEYQKRHGTAYVLKEVLGHKYCDV